MEGGNGYKALFHSRVHSFLVSSLGTKCICMKPNNRGLLGIVSATRQGLLSRIPPRIHKTAQC